ncbi:MAG: sensor histidine kinase [Clostridiales bacterium]|jgi:two-component system sensor histidine kinase YesM|nr:sensor histidine kinase [Bacillota bacterium]NLL55489.1 sensor histidine kinase [Clostridiales bacterium]
MALAQEPTVCLKRKGNKRRIWKKHGTSMKTRLFLTYFCLTLIVAGILVFGSFVLYSRILVGMTVREKENSVTLAVNQVDALMKKAESISRLAVINSTLQRLTNIETLTAAEAYDYGSILKDDLNYLLQNSEYIANIIIYFCDERIYGTSGVDIEQYAKTGEKPVRFPYEKLEYKNRVKVINTRKVNYLRYRGPTNLITMYRPIISYTTTDIVGILQIDILETTIASILSDAISSNGTSFCVIDANNYVISSQDKKQIYTRLNEEYQDTGMCRKFGWLSLGKSSTYLSLMKQLSDYGWTAVVHFPFEEIVHENRLAFIQICFIGGLCILMALVPIFLMSRSILRPLTDLSRTMERVGEGEITLRADESGRDEISLLSHVFNGMMERIDYLILENKREQQQKRRFEFMAIQQQIQPHFLYNTLDNIHALITLGYNSQALHMTRTLGRFYRACLSGEQMLITLEQEMNIINYYLTIQKIRFRDNFAFHINFEEACRDVLVPKLIVQPLVENSLEHGIRECEYPGKISVDCTQSGEYLKIRVCDNGKGFSKEALRDFDRIHDEEVGDKRSFGIQSIINRLRFYYDPECRMVISNLDEGGSSVTITLRKEA